MGGTTIEKRGKYKGYDYLVVAIEMGHRCGYVKIPKSHGLYEKDYDGIELDVHGGLTFAGTFNRKGFPTGHWIGFDCAHLGDARDVRIMSNEYKKMFTDHVRLDLPGESIKNAKYVEKECKGLIDQLTSSTDKHD